MTDPVPTTIEAFRARPLVEQMELCRRDPHLLHRLKTGAPPRVAPEPPSLEEIATLKGLSFVALTRLPHAEQARLREVFPAEIDALRRQHLAAPIARRADPGKTHSTPGAALGHAKTEQEALAAAGFNPLDPPRYR